jgi:hypothetical protein
MTQDQCIQQAIGRVGRIGRQIDRAVLEGFAKEALEPMTKRDQTIAPGTVTEDKFDPETFTHTTVTRQIHPPRPVAPYKYGPLDVLWLEQELRRRAGL